VASPEALVWARRAFPGLDPTTAEPLPPAGSSRALTRLRHTGGSLVLVENPVEVTADVNENDAFMYLAVHLGARDVPVPGVLSYKRSRGWLLVEDFGDVDLFALSRHALGGAGSPEEREQLAARYREALDVLVRLQVDGAQGFDPRRTHNPPRYDVELMRQGESGYFLRELIVNHLGLPVPDGLDAELDRLAARAAEAGCAYLLHRDYQSQNLKVHIDRVCVIDFQGARLGPPQYDVAALLLDPYADLPAGLRAALLEHYLAAFTARTGTTRAQFLEHFPAIAAHRLMQALGAYAFLGLRRGKPAFLAHVPTALRLLEETLAPVAGEAPTLCALVAAARRHPKVAAASGSGEPTA
jgi:aminoglycoside/choline kinase family phosphotransferase